VHSTKTISNLCHAQTLEEGRQVGRRSACDEKGTRLVHQCLSPILSLISQHYRRLVQVLDYHRIIPLLKEWSDTMVLYSGCCRDVLFFTDGKPWKMAKPGRR